MSSKTKMPDGYRIEDRDGACLIRESDGVYLGHVPGSEKDHIAAAWRVADADTGESQGDAEPAPEPNYEEVGRDDKPAPSRKAKK